LSGDQLRVVVEVSGIAFSKQNFKINWND